MEVEFVIPYPPSINRTYKIGKGRFFSSDMSKKYKFNVLTKIRNYIAHGKFNGFEESDILEITFYQYPCTNHRRDIDAGIKIMLDSLQISGIFKNDYQIKKLSISIMNKVEKEAFVKVNIKTIEKSL